ncbi:MAG: class I SAM-dependent rRNA methyltransferase [Deltaproteobacteria bacterium]
MRLNPGREQSVHRRHPWVFSGAVESEVDTNQPGQTVRVESSSGKFLGFAAWSPKSQIRLRFWSFKEQDQIDENFIHSRLQKALSDRSSSDLASNAKRLVHGEADGLPGLIVDQYNQVLVLQILSVGMEYWREILLQQLIALTGLECVFERSDAEVRRLEGLERQCGVILGELSPNCSILEHGLEYYIDVENGQKTGFYLDQRANRAKIQEISHNKEVLNCFCYTGGFSLNALRGGAKFVTSIDSSGQALQMAKLNTKTNGLPEEKTEWIEADVFASLRKFRDQGRNFDLIILDPPKFAPTKQNVEKASRAYKDINLLAMKLLNEGGLLATFSCSSAISPELFKKILASSAEDARQDFSILDNFSADQDHPQLLSFPEGEYLKGVLLQKRS